MSNIPTPTPMTPEQVSALPCPINDKMSVEQKIEALRTWEMLELGIDATTTYMRNVLFPVMDFVIDHPEVIDIMEESAAPDLLARIFFEPMVPASQLWAECGDLITDKVLGWFDKMANEALGSSADSWNYKKAYTALGVFDNMEIISDLYDKGIFIPDIWLQKNGRSYFEENKELREQVIMLFGAPTE